MTALRQTETDFMGAVTDLAELRGWSWLHLRPARTAAGWRTAISGPLGAGWPDLLMVRGSRLLVAELKAAGGRLTPEQAAVLALLVPAVECHVWRPADWPDILEVLA